MRKLSTNEVKEKNVELQLSKAFVKDVELGNVEIYEYETQDEQTNLLNQDWMYHSENDKIVGLRMTDAKLGWGLS